MTQNYPKIGLALGSGGAKGLAHIGVLRSLKKHHIPIDYIAAASIGSIIGAHYARFQDIQKLENVIMNFDRKQGVGLFDFTVKGGIIKGKKTQIFISEVLEDARFDDLKIPLAVVATDFNTAEQVVFSKGNLTKAIRASIAVPAIFQPFQFFDKLLADGGLSNPVPVTVAQSMGSDITIAVNLDQVYVENPLLNLPPLVRVPMHAINILRHNLALNAVSGADVVIVPHNKFRIGLIGWNNFFDNEKALQIIKEGEEATDKVIPEIKKIIAAYQKKQSLIQRFLSVFKTGR
jgi:NTE family protein